MIISNATKEAVIAVCYPVYKNERCIGSVVATINFSLIYDVIKDTKIAKEGYACMIDGWGDNCI